MHSYLSSGWHQAWNEKKKKKMCVTQVLRQSIFSCHIIKRWIGIALFIDPFFFFIIYPGPFTTVVRGLCFIYKPDTQLVWCVSNECVQGQWYERKMLHLLQKKEWQKSFILGKFLIYISLPPPPPLKKKMILPLSGATQVGSQFWPLDFQV